jgi:hypothetical protein
MGSFTSLGGMFTTAPAVVPWGQFDRFLFAFAVGRDQALWYAQLDGFTFEGATGTWSEWKSLGGVVTSAPHAVRSGESSVDVFAAGSRSELLHWQFRDGAWAQWRPEVGAAIDHVLMARVVDTGIHRNWESLGGILVSAPSATMFGEGNAMTLVFGVGTDHALWVRARDNNGWRNWDSLGHRLASAPCAVTFQRETFAVFALGIDSAIWYTMGSSWHSLGGTFSTAPFAISTHRHIHVFAADAHRALRHRQWDGNSWTDWESLGGILMSAPTANAIEGLIHVFGVGTDSGIWRRRWLGDAWTDWHFMGGLYLSPPATISRTPQEETFATRDLVALGTDHALWHLEEEDP